MTTPAEQLQAFKELAEKATPGPWAVNFFPFSRTKSVVDLLCQQVAECSHRDKEEADAQLIAQVHNILALAESLHSELEAARKDAELWNEFQRHHAAGDAVVQSCGFVVSPAELKTCMTVLTIRDAAPPTSGKESAT